MKRKRLVITVVLMVGMVIIGAVTMPPEAIFSKQFWMWMTILLFSTVVLANILGEEQFELFDHIDMENFKNAPVFGILAFPLSISIIALIWIGFKEFIIDAIIK